SEKRIGDMLTWSRVAVALRPDSPFAHRLLSDTWRALHEWGEAEASARRAIELGKKYPKYAGARVGLGNVMLQRGGPGRCRGKLPRRDGDRPALHTPLQHGTGLREAGRPRGGRGVGPPSGARRPRH